MDVDPLSSGIAERLMRRRESNRLWTRIFSQRLVSSQAEQSDISPGDISHTLDCRSVQRSRARLRDGEHLMAQSRRGQRARCDATHGSEAAKHHSMTIVQTSSDDHDSPHRLKAFNAAASFCTLLLHRSATYWRLIFISPSCGCHLPKKLQKISVNVPLRSPDTFCISPGQRDSPMEL
jgi:hypothetical protein